MTELHAGDFVAAPSRLSEYLDGWFASGPAQGWSPNTTRNYQMSMVHIKRRLGQVPTQELNRTQVRDELTEAAEAENSDDPS